MRRLVMMRMKIMREIVSRMKRPLHRMMIRIITQLVKTGMIVERVHG